MSSRSLMIGVSGIRGIVFDSLSPEVARLYASSLATLLGPGTYVVGRDTRPSGEVLSPAVMEALAACGCDVIDVGVAPTPTIQLAVEHHGAAGGIAITASHNPAEWNALKLMGAQGTFIVREQVEEIKRIAKSGKDIRRASGRAGKVSEDDQAVERHIMGVLDLGFLDAGAIGGRRFKVAVDCINGAGYLAMPRLLERLGCDVVKVYCDGSGDFKRNPEPVKANLEDLCRAVEDSGADIGFAVDPDADRLSIVDDLAGAIGEDYSIVLCADLVLSKQKGPVVVNLSTTAAIRYVTGRHGVELLRTPIGEINVVEKMKQVMSPVGGEGNGGVILPALHYGRDALVGAALVLQFMAERREKLSDLMTIFPRYAIVKTKAPPDDISDINSLRTRLAGEFEGAMLDDRDGLRFELGEEWLHIRKSGTEPIVRIIAEARGEREAQALVDRCIRAIRG